MTENSDQKLHNLQQQYKRLRAEMLGNFSAHEEEVNLLQEVSLISLKSSLWYNTLHVQFLFCVLCCKQINSSIAFRQPALSSKRLIFSQVMCPIWRISWSLITLKYSQGKLILQINHCLQNNFAYCSISFGSLYILTSLAIACFQSTCKTPNDCRSVF